MGGLEDVDNGGATYREDVEGTGAQCCFEVDFVVVYMTVKVSSSVIVMSPIAGIY